jgi:hypothetical protein
MQSIGHSCFTVVRRAPLLEMSVSVALVRREGKIALLGRSSFVYIQLTCNPARSELCGVVEAMFSLSYLYKAIGDRNFADRCELTAFNALPVMVTPDWWSHQYVAQTNQVGLHIS